MLKGAVNKHGEGNLEEHLQKLFNFLILHYPGQALEKFEEASYLIKNNMPIDQFMKIKDDRDYAQLVKDLDGYTQQMQKVFRPPVSEDNEEEPAEVPAVGHVHDLMALSKQWQWAGVGFGEQETYRLQKSLKKLSGKVGATTLKFFGKITGTESDYYIAEAEVEAEEDGGEEEAKDADYEPAGTGVNKFKYFVASTSLSEWSKLPDLAPAQLKAARQIKVLFTGNLERQIFTNPFFEGQEKHYLRAQIARIHHATTLTWKGQLKPTEDSETREIEPNQDDEGNDPKAPATAAMASLDMWVHLKKNILKNGTTSLKTPEAPEGTDWTEEETEAAMKALLESDPYAPLLSALSADSKIQVTKTLAQPAWTACVMGDQTEYQGQCNGVAVVRSLQWPGAYSFYYNSEVQQIYVGNGHKYEQNATFFPVDPPLIESDPKEYDGPQEPEQNPPPEPVAPAENENAEEEEAE